jgi:hypothetical protein
MHPLFREPTYQSFHPCQLFLCADLAVSASRRSLYADSITRHLFYFYNSEISPPVEVGDLHLSGSSLSYLSLGFIFSISLDIFILPGDYYPIVDLCSISCMCSQHGIHHFSTLLVMPSILSKLLSLPPSTFVIYTVSHRDNQSLWLIGMASRNPSSPTWSLIAKGNRTSSVKLEVGV